MSEGRYRKNIVKLSLTDDEYEMFLEKYIIVMNFKEIAKLTNEINKIGININQITRKVNETQKIEKRDLNIISELVEESNKRVDDLVTKLLGDY